MKKLILGFAVFAALSFNANATNCGQGNDNGHGNATCGNTTVPTSYDQVQDANLNAEKDRAWKEEQKQWNEIQTKYTEAAGKNLEGQVENLKTSKVDVSTFNEGQKRQDNALANETSERVSSDNKIISDQKIVDAKQDSAINGKVDKTTYSQDKQKQSNLDSAQDGKISTAQNTANVALGLGVANTIGLVSESAQRQSADSNLQNQISTNKSNQAKTDNSQNVRMDGIEQQAAFNDGRIGKTETRLDTAEQGLRDNQNQIAVTDERSINNAVRLDGVETKNDEQDIAISNKVDNSTFLTDQARQDKAQAKEAAARKTGDKLLQKNIDTESSTRATADNKLQHNISTEAKTRAHADVVLSNRIDDNTSTLVQHDKRIGNVENRVSNIENKTNQRFSDMDKRMGENRKIASAGVAGAGAMANIPQVSQDSTFSVGAGAGGYDGQNALAVGFSARINNNIVTKVSASTNSASEVLWGAGASVEW